jgi:hypothetical protein
MKKYQSHKIVEAAVIVGWDNGGSSKNSFGVWIDPGHKWVEVPKDFFARGIPKKDEDYLVRYEEGYLSWSPKAVFEAGYSEIKD